MTRIFYTLRTESDGSYQESGSKFLAYAYPVATKGDVEEKLQYLRALHPRARHLCYAYRLLGMHEITEYGSDAGEPSGSAGTPILNAIRSADLVQTAVIVVRYFGGTKLGIPGLIHAYRESARLALEAGERLQIRRMQDYSLDMPLQLQPLFFHAVKQLDIALTSTGYGERFSAQISIPVEEGATILTHLLALIAAREGDTNALAEWLDIHIRQHERTEH